jgi:hypothetical protein
MVLSTASCMVSPATATETQTENAGHSTGKVTEKETRLKEEPEG